MPEPATDPPRVPAEDPRSTAVRFRGWPRVGRWAAYVAITLCLVLVAGVAAVVTTIRRPFPETEGEIAVPGLGSQVSVLRDGNGIPQVYADTASDLFYAQGFVQAQDRFFEMDVRRHITAGRLSELVGEPALESDTFVRAMGWRRVAEREIPLLDPDTQDYLRAFSDGVNAYLGSRTASEISLEYTVLALDGLDYVPESWTPVDSVAWLKAMAWDLRSNMQDEVTRGILSGNHDATEIAELFPPYPYQRHRPVLAQGAVLGGRFVADAGRGSIRGRAALSEGMVGALEDLAGGLAGLPELVGRGDGIGSNAWVVGPERSTTGAPLLANDPHLGVSVPGVWYQMGLHCRAVGEDCPFDVSGFTFAGMPGVVIGHNQHVAWGFTNLGADVTDLYLEKVRGQQYVHGGRRRDLRLRDETIEVRGRDEPFVFTVRSTRHGPLLSDVSAELSTVGANSPVAPGAPGRGNGYGVALAWTALRPGTTADAVFALDAARGWRSFRRAAALFDAPAQNMVYADRAGHIGYQAPGTIPVRGPGNDGDYPAQGWLPEDDWASGTVPFRALPSVLDPGDGFVVTANQAVTGPGYAYHLGDSWAPGYRSQRVVDLLRQRDRLSVADMTRIQLDDRHGFAPTMVPYLLDVLMPSEYLGAGQRLLERWDYRQEPDSAAAAYFNAVWERTLALTFRDEVREAAWPTGGGRWFEVMRRLLADPTNHWWDDVHTPTVVETRDEVLGRALAEARDELVRRQARRAVDWTWGHHHRLDLQHQTLGRSEVAAVRWLFNRGGYQVGGGSETVDATAWDAASGSFDVTAAPSMRMVVSLGDLDDSRWVSLTGASGHAFADHYVDQTELWVEGETLPWVHGRKAVEAAAEDVLSLVPAA